MQQKEVVATPKALKKALEHEKTPELAAKLAAEAIERDAWAAQVSQLSLPKLVEQVALNAWKEESDNAVCLHLRSSQRHLNNRGAQQKLAEALSMLKGSTVELTIVEDDNPRCVRRWSGVRRYTKKNLRRRASPLLRIIIFRPCVGSSMRSWMKTVSAPFDRKHSLRSSSLT